MDNFIRMTCAILIAILFWAALVGILFLLPPRVALGTMFAGLVLFLVGAKLHFPWTAAVGGVLMFAGVFAAALLGGLG